MEVSKLHATVYWDKQRQEWAVVDMGSMHGTFHRSSSTPDASTSAAHVPSSGPGASNGRKDARGTRLSPPRVASVPRGLVHGDSLSFGSTTFAVHIHLDGLPCQYCSSSGGNEIPLFDHLRKQKRKRAASELTPAPVPLSSAERNPKKAMTMLKRDLLSRHEPASSSNSGSASAPAPYFDRSARRRALHTDAPEQLLTRARTVVSAPITPPIRLPEPVSAPAVPLPDTNIGHRLLMKQGWQPGTSLGSSDVADDERGTVALVEPLNISGNLKRTGLGMVSPPAAVRDVGLNWKEQGQQRRWDDVRKAGAG
ncbi:hypothetical protein EUX98_g3899 [Antrodiella citrinella]|uniref:G-patch domain-containing protein n=1 Tax=Antrodiella citrinella TaxID=2447956 RepID=A0A4S4MWD7_9APHY|nr:hypothetical protein EUX98_g3899 [Antrodiella citrinella]